MKDSSTSQQEIQQLGYTTDNYTPLYIAATIKI